MGLQLSPVIAGGGSGSGGSGDVVGPASSTDNAIARFDGTTGLLLQNSGVLIDDSNNITIPGTASVAGLDISLAGSAANPSLTINSTNSGFYAHATDGVALSAAGSQIWRVTSSNGLLMSRRFQIAKTANTASATSFSIGTAGNVVPVTGSTTISRISSTNWTDGSSITLILPSSITVEHLSASGSGAQVNLAGAIDLTTTAVTYLHLLLDGGVWIEMYRRVMP